MALSKKDERLKVFLLNNGNFAVFDNVAQQVPEMQSKSAVGFIIERAEECGYDPSKMKIELPGGRTAYPFRVGEKSWNYKIR